ncbi:hypothetical protein [Metabacillus sp. RGM 3146]|uniref:hypothetical protein n=1 Tax=Metabacillus sp. RGM 3146 TaxID=3401092 RepID=UPI003B9DB26F
MFDPTIFDNLKVVLEGEIYDRDLDQEIIILDRTDIVNLSDMSRMYRIKFAEKKGTAIASVEFQLFMSHKQMYSEWKQDFKEAGCDIKMIFAWPKDLSGCKEWTESSIKRIWGEEVLISHETRRTTSHSGITVVQYLVYLEFDRMINEDNALDLESMVSYALETIRILPAI